MCPQMYSLPMGELECEHMLGRPDTSHFHLCTAWVGLGLESQETLMG